MVKLYYFDVSVLKDECLFESCFSSLNESDKLKVDKIKHPKEKMLSLGARLLLNYALKQENINSYSIIYGEHGKPYLKDNPVYFNISHSESVVILSVSDSEIGCDIEYIGPNVNNIASKYFTDEENEYIDSSSDKVKAFFEIWTLKESFMKATGFGLSAGISSFSVSVSDDNISVSSVYGNDFSFYEIISFPGYACSVCVKGDKKSDIDLIEFKL